MCDILHLQKILQQTQFAQFANKCNRPSATAFGSFVNGFDDAKQLVHTALANNAMYAMRATLHSGITTTPGTMAF
jgi:hypothetical protein